MPRFREGRGVERKFANVSPLVMLGFIGCARDVSEGALCSGLHADVCLDIHLLACCGVGAWWGFGFSGARGCFFDSRLVPFVDNAAWVVLVGSPCAV